MKREKDQEIKQKGLWKRFTHMLTVANIPYVFFGIYIFLIAIEGKILVSIPEINGNFFSGDVSVKSVGMFLGFELLNMVVCQFVLYINHILRYQMNRNLRNALWDKILKLKPSYFDKVSSNTLISRITVDADSINTFIIDVALELFVQIYYLTLTIAEMSKLSIKAGFMLMAFLPLTFLFAFLMGRLNLVFESKMKYKLADLTNYLSELISCLPLLKSVNRQHYEFERGHQVIDDYYKANRNVIVLGVVKDVIGTLIGIGPEIVIILMGIKMLNEASIDGAGWYTFYLYAGTFINFCSTLGSLWQTGKATQGQLYKVSEVLYEEEESLDSYIKDIVESSDLAFDQVSFGYDENNIVDNASLTILNKQTNVIIGYSGAGKSTILKLLERLYEPNKGRIMMNGQNIHDISIKDWRKKLVLVSQETPLLSGSIRDNILYGLDKNITDEEIMKVAKLAHIDEFINANEEGLDYQVGQFGNKLSGGQKQKISICRALLSKPEILILDEPTASLDVISTNEILHTIQSLHEQLTIVLVTHDQKMIAAADHVIVVNKDHSIIEGNKKEVNIMSDYYHQLMEGKE